jgi:hypothetical protein
MATRRVVLVLVATICLTLTPIKCQVGQNADPINAGGAGAAAANVNDGQGAQVNIQRLGNVNPQAQNGAGQQFVNRPLGFANKLAQMGPAGGQENIRAAAGKLGDAIQPKAFYRNNPNVDDNAENRHNPGNNAPDGGVADGDNKPFRPAGDSLRGHGQPNHPIPKGLPKRPAAVKLAESVPCKGDIKMYCSASSQSNNFAILDCLQNDLKVI